MQEVIKKTFFVNQPPEKVWDYLTKPELLEQWMGKTDFEPIMGKRFRFISPYGNDSICEVLEIKPFSRLSYSWQKNSANDNKPFNSIITWTLLAKDEGTKLLLVHEGFRAVEDIAPHENGWNIVVQQLKDLLQSVEQR